MARSFLDTKYINLADNADQRGMAAVTWSAWVKYTAVGTSGGYFWGKPLTEDQSGHWTSDIGGAEANKIRCRVKAGGSIGSVGGSTTLSTSTWYHITGRYDGTNLRIYLDGVQDGSVGKTGTVASDTDAVFIGAFTGHESVRHLVGEICECAMWDRSLSVPEINAVFRYGVLSVLESLVVYIPVDGNPTTELEVINNRGTLTHTGSPVKADHPVLVGIRTDDNFNWLGIPPPVPPPTPTPEVFETPEVSVLVEMNDTLLVEVEM